MEIGYSNTGQIINTSDEPPKDKNELSENEKELVAFVVDHTDEWREYRDQNFMDEWLKYERTWQVGKYRQDPRLRAFPRYLPSYPAGY